MSDEEERNKFLQCSAVFATAIAGACQALERDYSTIKDLPIPGGYDKHDVGCMVCAGLLLTLLGVLAEEDEGKPQMLRAVQMLGDRKYPLGQDIRITLNQIMDTLGMKDERHRWN